MSIRTRRCVIAAIVLTSIGCQMGNTPGEFAPATSPQGTEVRVTYEQAGRLTDASGELIEARADGLLVLLPRGFTRIDYDAISVITFGAPGGSQRLSGVRTAEERQRLAQLSRYPVGLTDDQVARLLQARGQERLIEVDP